MSPAHDLGEVFVDANRNGRQDAGESALTGITVTLRDRGTNGQVTTMTATTDANGHYRFASVPAGEYRISFALPFIYAPAGPAELAAEVGVSTNNVALPAFGVQEQMPNLFLPLINR